MSKFRVLEIIPSFNLSSECTYKGGSWKYQTTTGESETTVKPW